MYYYSIIQLLSLSLLLVWDMLLLLLLLLLWSKPLGYGGRI
jgi:hypothetical protein